MSKRALDKLIKHGKEESLEIAKDKRESQTMTDGDEHQGLAHRNWRPENKDTEVLAFLSLNVNSLSHWSSTSNKTKRFKHIFKEYKRDTVSLQKLCIN